MNRISDRDAARRRLHKLKQDHPQDFCLADGCLHTTVLTPCPFHPIGERVRLSKPGVEHVGKVGTVDRASGPFLWVLLDDGNEVKVPKDWTEVVDG